MDWVQILIGLALIWGVWRIGNEMSVTRSNISGHWSSIFIALDTMRVITIDIKKTLKDYPPTAVRDIEEAISNSRIKYRLGPYSEHRHEDVILFETFSKGEKLRKNIEMIDKCPPPTVIDLLEGTSKTLSRIEKILERSA